MIAAASMIPSSPETNINTPSPSHVTTTTQSPYFGQEYVKEEHVISEYHDYSGGVYSSNPYMDARLGWSAYFGLLAALLSVASAISASLYYGKSENEDCEDTIPLHQNVV